jgi:hypothetical protein
MKKNKARLPAQTMPIMTLENISLLLTHLLALGQSLEQKPGTPLLG